jgi:hypothetical protein
VIRGGSEMIGKLWRRRRAGVAVLIDAENLRPGKARMIMEKARAHGPIVAARCYGDWSLPSLSSWRVEAVKTGIAPVQSVATTGGKNASDIRLVIDAVELLHRLRPATFCLASNDGDFAPLATHLRSEGAQVHCLVTLPSATLLAACDGHVALDGRLPTSFETEWCEAVVAIARERADGDGWCLLGTLGAAIAQDPALAYRPLGHKTLLAACKASGRFQFRTAEDGTTMFLMPRLRSTRTAAAVPVPAKAS